MLGIAIESQHTRGFASMPWMLNRSITSTFYTVIDSSPLLDSIGSSDLVG